LAYSATEFYYSLVDAAGIKGDPVSYSIEWGEPLPIELLSFDANKKGNEVLITWKTGKEVNNKGFNVEHIQDGSNWNVLQFIPTQAPQGFSDLALNYSAIHHTPAAGINMYRLEQIDMDGTTTYTRVAVVKFEHQATYSLVPNPANEYFDIIGVNSGDHVHVYDATGRLIINKVAETNNSVTIDASTLHAGYYQVVINTPNGNTQSMKLIISK